MHTWVDRFVLVCAASLLLVSALAHGGRLSAKLDLLTHFAPIWLAASILVACYGICFTLPGWKVWITGLALLAAVGAAGLMAPEYLRPAPAAPDATSNQIRLIQLNAWKENVDVKATADWLEAERPDFITIDEVRAPITGELIRHGYHYTRGIAHTAIFSRSPPLHPTLALPIQIWPKLPGFSRSNFKIDLANGQELPLDIIAMHLPWPTDPEEKMEREALLQVIQLYPPDDLIVAGDFNLTPWSFALQDFDRRVGLSRRDKALFSWPGRLDPKHITKLPFPVLPIDHVYAGRNWKTVSVRRGPRLGSDHYPVVVILSHQGPPSAT